MNFIYSIFSIILLALVFFFPFLTMDLSVGYSDLVFGLCVSIYLSNLPLGMLTYFRRSTKGLWIIAAIFHFLVFASTQTNAFDSNTTLLISLGILLQMAISFICLILVDRKNPK